MMVNPLYYSFDRVSSNRYIDIIEIQRTHKLSIVHIVLRVQGLTKDYIPNIIIRKWYKESYKDIILDYSDILINNTYYFQGDVKTSVPDTYDLIIPAKIINNINILPIHMTKYDKIEFITKYTNTNTKPTIYSKLKIYYLIL